MILVRDVFHAKYGRGDELVRLFKEMERDFSDMAGFAPKLLTDLSGPFFTVVTEYEVESFAAWESMLQKSFSDPKFGEWFNRMIPLVDSGKREFYTIVK
jgi:hypothetical protein